MYKSEKQLRHESLLKWAATHSQYESHKQRPAFFSEPNNANTVTSLKSDEINPAVVILTDVLNLPGGSIAGENVPSIDLYRLMQTYLTDLTKRKIINDLMTL